MALERDAEETRFKAAGFAETNEGYSWAIVAEAQRGLFLGGMVGSQTVVLGFCLPGHVVMASAVLVLFVNKQIRSFVSVLKRP